MDPIQAFKTYTTNLVFGLNTNLNTFNRAINLRIDELSRRVNNLPSNPSTPTVRIPVGLGVSVKEFGAVGDGVTDDTAAFQAACNQGGLILLEGTHLIQATVFMSSNCVIKGTRKTSLIVASGITHVFFAEDKENVGIIGVKAKRATGNTDTPMLFCTKRCQGIVYKRNATNGILGLNTHRPDYALTTEDSLCRDVLVESNSIVNVDSGPYGGAITLNYVDGAVVSKNRVDGCLHAIMWWGGDGNPVNGQNNWQGTAPKWARNIIIVHNKVKNVEGGGYWGSMGSNVIIDGNLAEKCNDLCFDFEATDNSVASNNVAINGKNAGLGVFYGSSSVDFVNNKVVNDANHGNGFHAYGNIPSKNIRIIGGSMVTKSVTADAIFSEEGMLVDFYVGGGIRIETPYRAMILQSPDGAVLDKATVVSSVTNVDGGARPYAVYIQGGKRLYVTANNFRYTGTGDAGYLMLGDGAASPISGATVELNKGEGFNLGIYCFQWKGGNGVVVSHNRTARIDVNGNFPVRYGNKTEAGAALDNDSGSSLPVASKSQNGVVRIGDGLSIDNTGLVQAYQLGYSVKQFGAVGDGVADDAAAIQAAINFARTVQYRLRTIVFPDGVYKMSVPIDATNIPGLSFKGVGGPYTNAMIVGNTGGVMFDLTGSTLCSVSDIALASFNGDTAPSNLALFYALSEDANGNQVGGLNCRLSNVTIFLANLPTHNQGLGSIGFVNIRSEEMGIHDVMIRANTGAVFSTVADLRFTTDLGNTFASVYSRVSNTGAGSMGVVTWTGQCSIQCWEKKCAALVLNGTNTFSYQGYIGRVYIDPARNDPNETAIRFFQSTYGFNFHGTIESFSQVLNTQQALINSNIQVTTANHTAPNADVIHLEEYGSIQGMDLKLSFGNPAESVGRYIFSCEQRAGGEESSLAFLKDVHLHATQVQDSRYAIKLPLLRMSDNVVFNVAAPFEKKSGRIHQLFTVRSPAGQSGTVTSAVILRFLKADKANKAAKNAGSYSVNVAGNIIAGSYESGYRAVLEFSGNILLAQQLSSAVGVPQGATTVINRMSTNDSQLRIDTVQLDLVDNGDHYAVTATPVVTGASGEAIIVNSVGSVQADFYVNDTIVYT